MQSICMCSLPSCEQKLMMLKLLSHLPFALFILIQHGMTQEPQQLPSNGKTSDMCSVQFYCLNYNRCSTVFTL